MTYKIFKCFKFIFISYYRQERWLNKYCLGMLKVLWGKILGKLTVQLEPLMMLQQGWLSGKSLV